MGERKPEAMRGSMWDKEQDDGVVMSLMWGGKEDVISYLNSSEQGWMGNTSGSFFFFMN